MVRQVRSVIWRLFELAPTPAALAAADPAAVRAIVEPLGLAPKRVPMLQRFSREYLDKDVRTSSPAPSHPLSVGLIFRGKFWTRTCAHAPLPPASAPEGKFLGCGLVILHMLVFVG